MKTTTVPAQITTVEDKIAGNLTLQQMVLLASPVFIDFALYALLPAMLKLNAYKLVLMSLVTITASLLAIRVKSKILLVWAITIFSYNARPGYYVFNKNNIYLRAQGAVHANEAEQQTAPTVEQLTPQKVTRLSEEDVFRLERILANPSANLSFATSKKGGLYVSISEIK
jgi:hypothetical protein